MNAKKPATVPAPRLAVGVEEAAELLGLGRSSVFILMKDGTLKSLKVGKRRLIAMSELEAFLARLQKGTGT
jgi:excisionase family DNA binding protein